MSSARKNLERREPNTIARLKNMLLADYNSRDDFKYESMYNMFARFGNRSHMLNLWTPRSLDINMKKFVLIMKFSHPKHFLKKIHKTKNASSVFENKVN